MLLNYDDHGPGPVVALLHGFPLDHTMWEFQSTTVGSIYRVIAPDLRGHGKTAAPDGVYTIDGMADDVVETLDALGLGEPIVLGGMSMGGYVALSIAARFPGRVRALILVNTRAGADTPETARVREDLARQVDESGSADTVVAAMAPGLFAEVTQARHPDLIVRTRERMARTSPRAVAGTLRGMAIRPDRTAALASIAVPTLVLFGADDRTIPPAESQSLAAAIPGARLVSIPDAGHMAPLENPLAVNQAILDFLGPLG